MLIVENHINVVGEEELDNDSREVFKEDKETIEANLTELRAWILSSPHLKNVRQDDLFLRYFLRGCNYSLANTKDRLDLYFTARSVLPCWFGAWEPREPQVEEVLRAGVFLPLHGYDRQGRYCFLVRLAQLSPSTMQAENCFKVFIMMFALTMEGNRQANTKGMSIIVDMEGMTVSHATMMTPTLLKKLVVLFLETYPLDNDTLTELSRLYFLNMPKVLEKLFSLFVSFLTKRLRKTISLQDKNCPVLLAELGEEILPAEYGGTNTNTGDLTEFWLKEMVRQSAWLAGELQFRTDETARVGKDRLSGRLSCSVM